MFQGAGWHSRADPRDHYGGDDVSAKLNMFPLEAVVIPPEGGPKCTKGENLQNHAHSVCVNRLVWNTAIMTLIVSDYKEMMKSEPLLYDCQNSIEPYVIYNLRNKNAKLLSKVISETLLLTVTALKEKSILINELCCENSSACKAYFKKN